MSQLNGTPRSEAVTLYLDLLKRSLTNTLFATEPDADNDSEARYIRGSVDRYIRSSAVSMLPLVRFDQLRTCICDVIEQSIPGDLIETGVWRGGATIFMRAVLKVYGITDRTVWAADSFEGLPEPDPETCPVEAKHYAGPIMSNEFDRLAVSFEDVRRNFAVYGMLDEQVRFLRGWFKDTLPGAPMERLAVLRLDGDYYESTRDALTALYDKVSLGGYIIIDDYGEDRWTYCAKAVDEFRQERGIAEPLTFVDSKCCYWRRER